MCIHTVYVCLWQHLYVCLSLLENNVFVFQQWYTSTMNLLGTWLTDRMDLQLHLYQLKILIRIVKVKTTASLTTKVGIGGNVN